MTDGASRLVLPGGQPIRNPAAEQAAAIRAELEMGRLALRVLAILLSEMKGRKTAIKKDRWPKLGEKYPGAFVRFGEEAERITVRLVTPEELAAENAPAPNPAEAGS